MIQKPLLIFDPIATWKQKTLTNFYARELLVPIFKGGELVYQLPTLEEIKDYAQKEVDTLWEEVKRFENLIVTMLIYPKNYGI